MGPRKRERISGEEKRIIIFTISVDSQDPVLAQTMDWLRGFAGCYNQVVVFDLHTGEVDQLPGNVLVLEFWGTNPVTKLFGVIKVFKYLLTCGDSLKTVVLYHMITWPIFLFGLINRRKKRSQGVWYSHHYADFPLRIASGMVDCFFSPTEKTFPLKKKSKLVATGHTLDFSNIPSIKQKNSTFSLTKIYCIGRISPVKRIEILIEALGCFEILQRQRSEIVLVGPVQDKDYLVQLEKKAGIIGVPITVLGPLSRKDLLSSLTKVNFVFNATPISVDKSALEACGSGAIPITDNSELMKLVGMDTIWSELLGQEIPAIQKQIELLYGKNEKDLISIASHVQTITRAKNSMSDTLSVIERCLS